MSDPFKEAQIRQDRNSRESVYEDYEPVVLWVKPGRYMVDETRPANVEPEEVIRRKLREHIDTDFMDVKIKHEPHVEEIITEFDK